MKTYLASPPTAQRQQGVVLVVALILLIVLTLLGISAMDTTVLEHRLAKNNEERIQAFQAGEAGLLQARNVFADNTWIQAIVASPGWSDPNIEATTLPGIVPAVPVVPVIMSRKTPGDTTQVSRTVPGQTQMEFKGFFTPQRGAATEAWSVTQTQSVYFETRAVGANLADNNAVQVTLRNGVRQGAPKAQ